MQFTVEEIKAMLAGNIFRVEGLGHISKYKFTDVELFLVDDPTSCAYSIYAEGKEIFIETSKPIFGVTNMRIGVEKIQDLYLIITLFSKDNDQHVVTLEKTLDK